MSEENMAQLRAIKTIMELCFHQNEVDRIVDALVVLGVKRDQIVLAMSLSTDDMRAIGLQ